VSRIQISDRHYKARIFRGGYLDVFINPSQSELVKVASRNTNSIRFTADNSPHIKFVFGMPANQSIMRCYRY
jgi:hypothetical protein